MDETEHLKSNDVPEPVIQFIIKDNLTMADLLCFQRSDFTEWAHEHKIGVAAKIKLVNAIKRKSQSGHGSSGSGNTTLQNKNSTNNNTTNKADARTSSNNNVDSKSPTSKSKTRVHDQSAVKDAATEKDKQTLQHFKSLFMSTQHAIDQISNKFTVENGELLDVVNEMNNQCYQMHQMIKKLGETRQEQLEYVKKMEQVLLHKLPSEQYCKKLLSQISECRNKYNQYSDNQNTADSDSLTLAFKECKQKYDQFIRKYTCVKESQSFDKILTFDPELHGNIDRDSLIRIEVAIESALQLESNDNSVRKNSALRGADIDISWNAPHISLFNYSNMEHLIDFISSNNDNNDHIGISIDAVKTQIIPNTSDGNSDSDNGNPNESESKKNGNITADSHLASVHVTLDTANPDALVPPVGDANVSNICKNDGNNHVDENGRTVQMEHKENNEENKNNKNNSNNHNNNTKENICGAAVDTVNDIQRKESKDVDDPCVDVAVAYDLKLQNMIEKTYSNIHQLWQYNPIGTLKILHVTKAVVFKKANVVVNVPHENDSSDVTRQGYKLLISKFWYKVNDNPLLEPIRQTLTDEIYEQHFNALPEWPEVGKSSKRTIKLCKEGIYDNASISIYWTANGVIDVINQRKAKDVFVSQCQSDCVTIKVLELDHTKARLIEKLCTDNMDKAKEKADTRSKVALGIEWDAL